MSYRSVKWRSWARTLRISSACSQSAAAAAAATALSPAARKKSRRDSILAMIVLLVTNKCEPGQLTERICYCLICRDTPPLYDARRVAPLIHTAVCSLIAPSPVLWHEWADGFVSSDGFRNAPYSVACSLRPVLGATKGQHPKCNEGGSSTEQRTPLLSCLGSRRQVSAILPRWWSVPYVYRRVKYESDTLISWNANLPGRPPRRQR